MKLLQHKSSKCISAMIKPLRIFQFFMLLLLFAFTIYIIFMDPSPISSSVCIFLIVLSGMYIFILAIELINHFAGAALHVIPMAIFSLLGFLSFGVLSFFIWYTYTHLVLQLIVIILCLLLTLLFLIDITMILAFWKRRCSVCKRCCNNSTVELLQKDKETIVPVVPVVEVKERRSIRDVTTSLSDIKLPRELPEGVVLPDHSYRKIEYPQRREYVECSTCVPSLCNLSTAQIQTETKKVSIRESQTSKPITEETPAQTISKCELCHQQIQLPLVGETDAPNHSARYSSQWRYPAIVQIVRGGSNIPCCTGCKCVIEDATPKIQPQSESMKQYKELTKKELMSETIGGNEVTKLTPVTTAFAAFYSPDKKMQDIPNIYKQKMDTIKIKEIDSKLTSKEMDQKFMEETIMKIAKTKKPEIVEKSIFEYAKKRKGNIKESEEERTEIEGKIEKSKAGGERCNKLYQEFICTTEQENVNVEESPIHVSGTSISPLSNRTKSRTLLHLKSNKVDPIKNTNYNEDCTFEKVALKMDNQVTHESERPTKIESPNSIIEHSTNDVCSFCRRQKSLMPTSDNSRYYIIFKDKKGKYFCEFCAPLDSKKIMSRVEDTDLKKLRCTNCRLHFRDRGIKTNIKLKSDICPNCGRSQRHTTSPSST